MTHPNTLRQAPLNLFPIYSVLKPQYTADIVGGRFKKKKKVKQCSSHGEKKTQHEAWDSSLPSGGNPFSAEQQLQTALLFWELAIKNVWTQSCQLRLRPAEIHLEPESAQGRAASSQGASPSTNKIVLREETVINW